MPLLSALTLSFVFALGVAAGQADSHMRSLPLAARFVDPGYKHREISRHGTLTAPRKRQASEIPYPVCEGSPSSGTTVYGTMTGALYGISDGEVAIDTYTSTQYACAQVCASLVPEPCVEIYYNTEYDICQAITGTLTTRADGVTGAIGGIRDKDCAQLVSEGFVGSCCNTYI